MRPFAWCTQQSVHMTVHMRSELIWPASLAIILQSRHDLEVRSWISRMRRLSACAQGAKSSNSKASMSAFGWLHQEGGAWQCGAVSRSASGSKHVQGRSASESGHAVSLLTAARVSSITRHRAAVLRVMQGEARAARAGAEQSRLQVSSFGVGGRGPCVPLVHGHSLISGSIAAVTKISCPC